MKDEVLRISKSDYDSPRKKMMETYKDLSKYAKIGPIFPDGSINWQCPCMAGGSLVAHRCGYLFRELYICMKKEGNQEAAEKCPNQFVNWAACMQNMSVERREKMREAILMEK